MKNRPIYIFLIVILLTGILPASAAPAPASQINNLSQINTCDQAALDEAEATFKSRLSENGQVPVDDPIAEAAAQDYIRLSKYCYDAMVSRMGAGSLQGGEPGFIDDGGIIRSNDNNVAEAYVASSVKWGANSPYNINTPPAVAGGTVTYSFMGNGLNLSVDNSLDPGKTYGSSVALTSLPGYQLCFITDIQTAFAAWSAVSNIQFVQVADSNTAFDASNATGDIRIGAHAFDGPTTSGGYYLAHAYYPPPNGGSGAGDIHFDKAEPWTCNTSGIDIGIVALHEIGHSLGLKHEDTSAVAVMDPIYNSSLSGLQIDDIAGAQAIYGAAPASLLSPAGNDTIGTATLITGLTYQNQVNTTAATPNGSTPVASDPNPISCTDPFGVSDSVAGGWSTVWYKYKTPLTVDESIQADTKGTTYDTYIAVYQGDAAGNLPSYSGFIGCNDDSIDGNTSRISFIGTKDTWYYFEVAHFKCFEGGTGCGAPTPTGGDLVFNVNITNTDVTIGGVLKESYYIFNTSNLRDVYATENNGPVRVKNLSDAQLVSSLRVIFDEGGVQRSYSEMMGFPADQLTNEYLFPWYNNVGLNSQLRIGNVGDPTTVKVYIAGVLKGSYPLDPDEGVQIKYTGVNAGPVRIVSTNPTDKITGAMRVIFDEGGYRRSYSELMGFPANQLTNEYLFPWYNNVGLNSQFRIGNAGAPTTVKVYIAGILKGSYPLGTDQGVQIKYAGVNAGPVRIVSTNSTDKITAAMRVIFDEGGVRRSYSELMGFPANQLTDKYYLPVYDNVAVNSQLRIGNAGAPTTVTVYIGGTYVDDYVLDTDESVQVKYAGVNDGPVYVYGANTTDKITVAMRMIYDNRVSYSEIMGFPGDQLTTEYLFPWYNNVGLNSELRIAAP